MLFGWSIQNLPWVVAKGPGRNSIHYTVEDTDSAANAVFWFQRHNCHSARIVLIVTEIEGIPKGLELTIFSHSLKEK